MGKRKGKSPSEKVDETMAPSSKLSPQSRAARTPRPPEELVDAHEDRIHPASGRLLRAKPIKTLKRKGKSPSEKVDEMMARKVDLRPRPGQVGEYPDLHEKLALDLAREYQIQEDPDYVSISWPNQEKAQDYFNTHGFEATLTHLFELRQKRGWAPEDEGVS